MLLLARYWKVGLLAAVLAFMGVQQWRIGHLQTALAEEKSARSAETADRERVAREHTEKINQINAQHARAQQESEDVHQQKIAELARARAAERARVDGLRVSLEAATSRGAWSAADPVACERQADRHEELGRLASEGVGLLEEGRSLLADRDEQVMHLLRQVQVDRAAVEETGPPAD